MRGAVFRKLELPHVLIAVMLAQICCAAFFLGDVALDFSEVVKAEQSVAHWLAEALAAVSLLAAIWFEYSFLLELTRRKERLEKSLSMAKSAIFDVIHSHFDNWQLTGAERDVANFVVKGCSISEIAELRGRAEGTIKAHLNAIYRKSGTKGRGELLSLIIEELVTDPSSHIPSQAQHSDDMLENQ